MNHGSSELCFQKFLEGAESTQISNSSNANCNQNSSNGICGDMIDVENPQPLDHAPKDPGDYAAVLKKKLDIYCAAVAKSMGSKECSSMTESGTTNTNSSQLSSQSSFNGSAANGRSSQIRMHDSVVTNNSSSSKELYLSDKDEESLLQGDDTNNDSNSTNEKKNRRMLSNLESARRSRKRKQVHVSDLESQVSQLRVENASLKKRLSEMTRNFDDTSVANRVLKADIETLKTKVKIAEDTVTRLTGGNPWYSSSIPDVSAKSAISMELFADVGPVLNVSVLGKEDHITHLFCDENHGIEAPVSNMNNNDDVKMCRSESLHRVASLDHLQKRMYSDQLDHATWHDEMNIGDD